MEKGPKIWKMSALSVLFSLYFFSFLVLTAEEPRSVWISGEVAGTEGEERRG